jgi:hypothetical protein
MIVIRKRNNKTIIIKGKEKLCFEQINNKTKY